MPKGGGGYDKMWMGSCGCNTYIQHKLQYRDGNWRLLVRQRQPNLQMIKRFHD